MTTQLRREKGEMSMINRHLIVVGAALALSVSALAAVQAAEMKYTYTGNTFVSGNGLLINPCTPGVGCDIASITVEFIHEQLPTQALTNILAGATSWSISDGLTTVTALSPGWNTLFFSVGTGAEAIPVPNDWQFLVFVAGIVGDPTEIRTIHVPGSAPSDLSQYCQGVDGFGGCNSQGTATVAAPGSWTVSPVEEPPPEEIPPEVIDIEIDISPWTKRNWIVPWSRGYVAVAVHSVDEFDARQIDETTVRFGPAEASVATSYFYDIGRDGDIDALYIFKTRKTGIQCGDTEAMLTGQTLTGADLAGIDKIRTIFCRSRR